MLSLRTVSTTSSAAMKIAEGIAEAFRHAPVKAKLEGHGICEMSVEWDGHRIHLSWYGAGSDRRLDIDGDGFFPKGSESAVIFRAARGRADQLVHERLEQLAASNK